jgi:hypothetical protein
MSARPEPTSQTDAQEPEPEDLWAEAVTPEEALAFVRTVAAQRDPTNARHYTAASAGRIKDGVDLARRLLAAHLPATHLQGRRRRGRRGRDATTDAALQEELSLVLALTWLEAAYGLLPPSRPPQNE